MGSELQVAVLPLPYLLPHPPWASLLLVVVVVVVVAATAAFLMISCVMFGGGGGGGSKIGSIISPLAFFFGASVSLALSRPTQLSTIHLPGDKACEALASASVKPTTIIDKAHPHQDHRAYGFACSNDM